MHDFLISGSPTSEYYKSREEELAKAFRWGKWEEHEITFAGTTIKQAMDKSITLDQHSYTLQWIEEVEFDKNKAHKTPLSATEISATRAALGTISWRATQSAPQFC